MSNLSALKFKLCTSPSLIKLATLVHMIAFACLLSFCDSGLFLIGVLGLAINYYQFWRKDWQSKRCDAVYSIAYRNKAWYLSTKEGEDTAYAVCHQKLALESMKLLEFSGAKSGKKKHCLLIFRDQLSVEDWHHLSLMVNLNH